MNSYELSRNWFDWCFDNPEKIKPNHTALYFFCIEHCNRLGWQEKFGLPTEMAKSAIGIHSYNTYISTLNDLIEFGFIKLITKSKNQFSSNIIGLSNFDKATTEALDKAMIKHASKQHTKQGESIVESNDSINKQLTNTETKEQRITNEKKEFGNSLKSFIPKYGEQMLRDFFTYWSEPNQSKTKLKFQMQKTWELSGRLQTWKRLSEKNNIKNGTNKITTIERTANAVAEVINNRRNATGLDN